MRRILMLPIWLIWISLAGLSTEVGSIRGFLYGSEPACAYDNWVSHLAEGKVSNLNIYAPWETQNNDFGGYQIPTDTDLVQWAQVIQAWLALDFNLAQARIDNFGYPYEVVVFQDTDSGRLFYMLREEINSQVDPNGSEDPALQETGSFDYGWGLYIYDPSATRPMIITAPHPCDDYPSPVISLEAMLEWDARFLFINGAGREVAYYTPYYNNNQSISDPSRRESHPFNVAYQHACTQLRGITGRIEFSVQLHTYDWYRYPTNPPIMLSSGNGRWNPGSPIRDFQRSPKDIINNTPREVFAENQFGTHDPVNVDQYYCVYSDESIYYHMDGYNLEIPYNQDLPGAQSNRQMLFTEQANLYDVYSPFLHVEFDELPKCYEQTTEQWHQFYGWDPISQSWPLATRYSRFISFYMPFLAALDECLDQLLAMDDGCAPSNPGNFRCPEAYQNSLLLAWERSYGYDFESYEIQIRYQIGSAWHHEIYDRNSHDYLARPGRDSFMWYYPDEGNIFYIRMRARDIHGNSSAWTEELKIFRPSPQSVAFSYVQATPSEGRVRISFHAAVPGAVGFNINRGLGTGPIGLHAVWQAYPELQVNASGTYEFWDTGLENGQIYRYQISAAYPDGSEFWHYLILQTQPYNAIQLTLTRLGNGESDLLRIGSNIFAADGQDDLDLTKSPPGTSSVWIGTRQNQGTGYLSLDLKSSYYPQSANKLWNLRAFCNTPGEELRLSTNLSETPVQGDLLVKDPVSGIWHDLRAGPLYWTNPSASLKSLELWWGYTEPRIEFPNLTLQALPAGSSINLSWQVVNPARVGPVELWMLGPNDSLRIASNLSAQLTAYSWQSPPQPLIGYRMMVKTLSSSGSLVRGVSPYLYDLRPHNMSLNAQAGHSLISIPVNGWTGSVAELFPFGTTAWQLNENGDWQSVSNLSSDKAYLVHSPQPWQLNLPLVSDYQSSGQELSHGWNLLANPHYHRYELDQLRFYSAGELISFADLAAQGKISPRLYTFNDLGWSLQDHLDPMTAAMIWCEGMQDPVLMLDPQSADLPQTRLPIRWELSFSALDGLRARDAVSIGVADDGSDLADPGLDFVKTAALPNQELSMYLTISGSGSWQSDFKGLYPDYADVAKSWNLLLSRPVAGAVGFRYSSNSLPDNYQVEVTAGGQSLILQADEPGWIEFIPGLHHVSLTVRSHPSPPNPLYDKQQVAVWPNPFRGSVNLRFDPPKSSEIKAEIYNLRGQKIRTLNTKASDAILTWDGKDHLGQRSAPGIYFIRLRTGSQSKSYRVLKLD